MSDFRRRESLGRNRQGPATRNLVPYAIASIVLFVGAGAFAFKYFTAPQRVYGSKVLNCSPTEITWSGTVRVTITGCGRDVVAVCTDAECYDERDAPHQMGEATF